MSEFNLSDEELNGLLKESLLTREDGDKMLDLQAKVLFAKEATVLPPPVKEKAMLSKLGAKTGAKISMGWIFTGLSVAVAVVTTSVMLMSNTGGEDSGKNALVSGIPEPKNEIQVSATASRTASFNEEARAKGVTINPPVAEVKSVTTMASVHDAEPVSTKTVTPVSELNKVSVSETKTATPSLPSGKIIEIKDPVKVAQPVEACKKPVSSCRIWKTKDLCSTPDSLKFPYGIECDNCAYTTTCKEYNSKKLTAVILRIYKKSGFTVDKSFQNIQLTRANGKKLTPVAISVDRFMSNVNKARINFKNVVDVVLLFAEAEAGDMISIDGVVQAVVEN